jgi:probable HAF family extracellular repeat protein
MAILRKMSLAVVAAAAIVLGCSGGGSDLTVPTQGTAAKIVMVRGDAQTATAGSPVATPPAAKVIDTGGNPVAGVPVTFAVTAGGGSVNPVTPVSTDATGVAAATSWTLGAVAGPNTLTATIPGTGMTGNPVTFTATGTPEPTVAIDIGPFATNSGCSISWPSSFYYSVAYDVNSSGVVVGETFCVAGEYLTFRWSQATGMQQLANFSGGYPITGGTLNKAGNIAATFNAGVYNDFRPVIWTPTNTRMDLVQQRSCDPQACQGIFAADINDNNEVVGSGPPDAGAWRWTPTTGLVYLPALGNGIPVAINGQGDIAAATPGSPPALGGMAILAATGTLTVVSGLQAQDMNDQRQVVGATGTWPTTDAVLWSQAEGIRNLGSLGGTTSYAYGINNSGEVVGSSTTSSGAVRAFYWSASRGMVDLGPGIAYAISDAGHMAGIAPSGFFPPDMAPDELWQATLWRGTGGVATSGVTARVTALPAGRAATCFNDAKNWESRTKMFRCLARYS